MRRNVTCLASRRAIRISDLNLTMAIHDGLFFVQMIKQHGAPLVCEFNVMGLMRLPLRLVRAPDGYGSGATRRRRLDNTSRNTLPSLGVSDSLISTWPPGHCLNVPTGFGQPTSVTNLRSTFPITYTSPRFTGFGRDCMVIVPLITYYGTLF